MKKILTALLMAWASNCFGGANPVLQNPYTTNNTAASDLHVLSLFPTNGVKVIQTNSASVTLGKMFTNLYGAPIIISTPVLVSKSGLVDCAALLVTFTPGDIFSNYKTNAFYGGTNGNYEVTVAGIINTGDAYYVTNAGGSIGAIGNTFATITVLAAGSSVTVNNNVSATNVNGGSFSNVTLTGSSTIPNAATATAASNGVDQVVIDRPSGSLYFGNSPLALSNAWQVIQSGDVIRLPSSGFVANLTVTVPNVTVQGALLGTYDRALKVYTSGTVLTNGFLIQATNFTLTDCGINTSNGFGVYSQFGSQNNSALTINRVGITYNGGTNSNGGFSEGTYIGGNNYNIDGLDINWMTNGHGLILKGGTNGVVRHVHIWNAGGTLEGLDIKSAATNTLSQNLSISDVLIDGDMTAAIIPILIHADDEGTPTGVPITLSGVIVKNVEVNLPNSLGGIEVVRFYPQSTNDIIKNVHVSDVHAKFPNAQIFGSGYFPVPAGFSTNTVLTNIFITHCSLDATNAPGPFDISGFGWTNNWVNYRSVVVNGNLFNGRDNYWGHGSGGGNLANGTNAVNTMGGEFADVSIANTNVITVINPATAGGQTTINSALSFTQMILNNHTQWGVTNNGFGTWITYFASSGVLHVTDVSGNDVSFSSTGIAGGGGATISINAPGIGNGNMNFDASGNLGLGSPGTQAGTHNLVVAGTVTSTNGFISAGSTHIPVAVTVGSSPFTFTNLTSSALECYFSDAAAYSITKNGVGVYGSLAGDGYFILQPTNRFVITYASTTPTIYTNSW